MNFVEPLESRIAPAAVTVSYIDHDGDLVKLRASNTSPTAPPLDLADLSFVGGGDSGQLATLLLTDAAFSGASISFTVVRKAGGDGLAHVGRIDASGVNLGKVTVKGDLGVLDAGTGTGTAVVALTAASMGLFGTATQGGGGDLRSDFAGAVGSITILKDLKDAYVTLTGGPGADLGRFTIGRDLIGGATMQSGQLSVTGDVGPIKIGGSIVGGSAFYAGGIHVFGSIASLTVRGSIIGNAALFFGGGGPALFTEGQVHAGVDMGPVKVGGNLICGTGGAGGEIRSGGNMTSVTIGGSLIGDRGSAGAHICSEGNLGAVKIGGSIIGGSGFFSGGIESFGGIASVTVGGTVHGGKESATGVITASAAIGLVKIRGDLIGGSISGSDTDSLSSGAIFGRRIAGVTIGGSLLSGYDTSGTGSLSRSGVIEATEDIGFVVIKGSLIGNVTGGVFTPAVISARGQASPTDTTDLAIGKIVIGGGVEYARILAGHNGVLASNGNAQIGSVTVGGDWRASSLVAGIRDTNLDGFGNGDDTVISAPPGAETDTIIARIGSVTIKGLIHGTAQGMDHFGITAQQIGALTVNRVKIPLTSGTDAPIPLAPLTNDFFLREV